ncbi:MAG: thioredoxin [Phycisphaerales bacterium]|nr:MAG: thioredoxin [Phycisphaerales bacterium]
MAGNAIELTDASFESEVLAADVPVLVDFWAEWCQPCRALSPTIEQLADQYRGKVKVGKLNIDQNNDTAVRYSVSAIPTVLLFKSGEVVDRFVGMKAKRDYEAALNHLVPTA